MKYKDCIRIFYSAESITPDFNICDYGIAFDYIDFGDRYLRMPNFYNQNYNRQFELINSKPDAEIILKNKEDFCSFVYSNSKADAFRENLFNEVNKYKMVKSGGRFNNNIGKPVDDKIDFQSKFKFSIACENSSYSGYTTEKILDAFASYSIPIYWGDPDIAKVFNSKSFINCNDYSSFKEIIDKIKYIDENDEEYLKMMNEPIFCSSCYEQNNQLIILENFLYNIFDQEYKKAFRYNRSFYRRMYFEDRVNEQKAYKHTLRFILKTVYSKLRLLKLNNKKTHKKK